jgi:hypothetical protein
MHVQFIYGVLIMVLPNPHANHKHIVINQQMYGRHSSIHL